MERLLNGKFEAKVQEGLRITFGRGERIRTSDLSVPNRAHYQAVLRPGLTYQFWNGLFEADPPF